MLHPALERERQILINGLRAADEDLRANLSEIGAAGDIEVLHDFRVAMRRIRSLMSSLGPILPLSGVDKLREECQWLAGRTSGLRDYDVLLERLQEYLNDVPGAAPEAASALLGYVRQRRNRCRNALVRSLSTRRASRLFQSLDRLQSMPVRDPRWPLSPFAGPALWRAYKRVVKLGNQLNQHSPSARFHLLRKRCKRLRYLFETFGPLYADAERSRLLTGLRKLQNVLGDFQDFDTHLEILDGIKAEFGGDGTESEVVQELINELLVVLQRRRRRVRKKFHRRFVEFVDAREHKRRRRLFRANVITLGLDAGTEGYCHGWVDGTPVGVPVGKVLSASFDDLACAEGPGAGGVLICQKPPSAIVDIGSEILIPREIQRHLKIALLVTKNLSGGRDDTVPDLSGIGGIGLALDLTLRSGRDGPWGRSWPDDAAKGFDGACPISALIPIEDPRQLLTPVPLELSVNGVALHAEDGAGRPLPVCESLTEILKHFSLWPGDIVLVSVSVSPAHLMAGNSIEAGIQGQKLIDARVRG